jgi:hypothetical protein
LRRQLTLLAAATDIFLLSRGSAARDSRIVSREAEMGTEKPSDTADVQSPGQTTAVHALSEQVRLRFVILAVAVLPALTAGYYAQRSPQLPALSITADRPGLLFSEYLLDYGPSPVAPQPLLTPTLLVRNTTQQDISIDEIEASCGCVTPRVSAMTIAAGGEERMTIPIRTTGEAPGLREYSVTVSWQDSRPRQSTVTVRVVLPEPQVVIEPRVLGIVGSSRRAIQHSVTITDYRPEPLLVRTASSSSPLVGTELLDRTTTDDGSRATAAVHVAADTPPGVHRAILQFTTDDPERQHLQVPVILQGAPRPADQQVVVRPALVRLRGSAPSGESVLLRINVPGAWQVSHIDVFPSELQVPFEIVPAAEQGRQEVQVRVSLSSALQGKLQDGVITLVADEGQQMVSVPVSFVWPPSL